MKTGMFNVLMMGVCFALTLTAYQVFLAPPHSCATTLVHAHAHCMLTPVVACDGPPNPPPWFAVILQTAAFFVPKILKDIGYSKSLGSYSLATGWLPPHRHGSLRGSPSRCCCC